MPGETRPPESVAPTKSVCSANRPVSSTQVTSSTDPARRKISHGARALAVAARSRTASGSVETITSQPAASAISTVLSREPPSLMMTSRKVPAAAPLTSVVNVGTRTRSLSSVVITMLNIVVPGKCITLPRCTAIAERGR